MQRSNLSFETVTYYFSGIQLWSYMYFHNISTHENHLFLLNDEFNSHQCNREYSPTNIPIIFHKITFPFFKSVNYPKII